MRLLLGKKSNRSLKQASSSSPPPPTPPLTYPLPVLPPLVHVQTESCPTTPGKPVPALGKSSDTGPLRIHAMFSRSFSMNDISLTDRPGQPASSPTASPMPRPARKEFLNREQEALLMQSRRKKEQEKNIQLKSSASEYQLNQPSSGTARPRRRKTHIGGRQDDQAHNSHLHPSLPSRRHTSRVSKSDLIPSFSNDSSDHLDPDFDNRDYPFIRRSVSDPARPASPPYTSPTLSSLPLGAAPAWRAARDAIVSRGQSDESQSNAYMAPPLGKPLSSNWAVLETSNPSLSHSASMGSHPTLASSTSSTTSSLQESDEGSTDSLKHSIRKKLSALNVRRVSDETRSNITTGYTRKSSTNHIRRNFLSGRQKDFSASSNRDSGDSLDQTYFSSASSTSSLEIGLETLADPFERRMNFDSPIKTPSVYFQKF